MPHNFSFNTIAPFYDFLVRIVFQQKLQKAQESLLVQIPEKGHILILGGGAGWVLTRLVELKPKVSVVYVEVSEKMLTLSQQRWQKAGGKGQVSFRLGDESVLGRAEKFDYMLVPFVFDLYETHYLKTVFIPNLCQHLAEGGVLGLVDFRETDKLLHRGLIGAMFLFFRHVSGLKATMLPNYSEALQSSLSLLENST
ncbi:MAG: methyltransferase, partial [Spirosomataceae bacterium]